MFDHRDDPHELTNVAEKPDFADERARLAALIRAALDATRAQGLTVEPQCPFVKSFIDRHPDYADLVAA